MFSHIKSGFENDLEPTEFYLSPNYPNPFREKTKIKYCVAQTTRVKLTVFNSEGREIIKLVDEEKNPGTYEVEFLTSSCHSQSGQSFRLDRNLEAGIYFCRLEAGDYKAEMKMELIK
jgi:5-hydroxyisourate hydrolase-like protein (transthyretin family)